MIPIISKFPQDDVPWQVMWFGNLILRRNPNNTEEPLINVILRQLTDKKLLTMREVGVGQLPAIPIGSKWRNGKRILNYKDISRNEYVKREFNLHLSKETMEIVETGKKADTQKKYYLIPPPSYDFGKKQEALSAHCLCIKHNNDPYGIIIPIIEIIRFYYAGSTELCRILFNGRFHNNEDVLFDKKKSYLRDDRSYVLQLRKGYNDDDAWVVARIAGDQTALEGAKQIYGSMKLNLMTEKETYPKTMPPFTGNTKLKVWGKEIYSENKRRFLVLEIISCSGKFPYEKLTLFRDNPGRSSVTGTTESPESHNGPVKNEEKPGDGTRLSDSKEPDGSKKKYTEYLHHSRFKVLEGKEIIKPPNEGSDRYRRKEQPLPSDSIPVSSVSIQEIVSTGEPAHGESEVGPYSFVKTSVATEITISFRENRLSERLSNFREGVEALKHIEHERKVNIEYHHRAVIASNINKDLSFFPDTGAGHATWTSTHRGKMPRQVAIYEVKLNGNEFYLFEIEHVLKSDSYTTLMLYQPNLGKIDEKILIKVLQYCAENKGSWLKDDQLPELRNRKIWHTWKQPREFANKVFNRMNDAITMKKE